MPTLFVSFGAITDKKCQLMALLGDKECHSLVWMGLFWVGQAGFLSPGGFFCFAGMDGFLGGQASVSIGTAIA